jgi:5-methylthioadenosine/S-adenosylhomocysteine deaminase
MASTWIRGGVVLPMEGRKVVLPRGSVLFDGDTILAVGPDELVAADPRATGADVIDATGQAVIPGLTNGHMHSGLIRGTAESMSLWDWLTNHYDQSMRAVTPELAEAAFLLAYTENVRFGNTSVMDMYRHMSGAAAVAERVGLRATLVPYVADEPGFDYFETLATNLALLRSHRTASDGRVRTWVGLEHMFYCSPDAFTGAMALAEEFDTGLHTHSSESRAEVEESLRRFGRRPIEEFLHRGILSERTVIAHCVWLDDREIELMASTGTSAVHCPCSNMKLASGPARIGDMRAAGVMVGIGSDGEASNNNLDLFDEMKFASLLQKVSTLDATTGDPWDVLAMATLDGARAIGLGDLTGSLEVGKRADVVMVDLRRLHFVPVFTGLDQNVAAHLVFSASGSDVDSVWVDGRRLVGGGKVLTVDEAQVMATAQAAAEELFERRRRLVPAGSVPPPGAAADVA